MAHKQKSDKAQRKPKASGKLANDHNKTGAQAATQKNEGQRTPASRSDRDSEIGSDNQSRTRQGGPATPSGGKSR